MSDKLSHKLAEAFIRWPLPESVCADLCATKQQPGRIGTNLLSYIEAKQMMEQVVLPRIAELERENAALRAEVAPLREIVGVRCDAASTREDITNWTRLVDRADSAARLERELAEATAEAFSQTSRLTGAVVALENLKRELAALRACRPRTAVELSECNDRLNDRIVELERDNAALRAIINDARELFWRDPINPEAVALVDRIDAALQSKVANQADRIRYLEGATNHATGTPLTLMRKRAEKAEADNAALRAALTEWRRLCELGLQDVVPAWVVPTVERLWEQTDKLVPPSEGGAK